MSHFGEGGVTQEAFILAITPLIPFGSLALKFAPRNCAMLRFVRTAHAGLQRVPNQGGRPW